MGCIALLLQKPAVTSPHISGQMRSYVTSNELEFLMSLKSRFRLRV